MLGVNIPYEANDNPEAIEFFFVVKCPPEKLQTLRVEVAKVFQTVL